MFLFACCGYALILFAPSLSLGHLIDAAHSLVKPYVAPVFSVLLPKLSDPDAGVASCVLATVGRLACVGRDDMIKYLDQLLPLMVDTLDDKSSMIKREVIYKNRFVFVRCQYAVTHTPSCHY